MCDLSTFCNKSFCKYHKSKGVAQFAMWMVYLVQWIFQIIHKRVLSNQIWYQSHLMHAGYGITLYTLSCRFNVVGNKPLMVIFTYLGVRWFSLHVLSNQIEAMFLCNFSLVLLTAYIVCLLSIMYFTHWREFVSSDITSNAMETKFVLVEILHQNGLNWTVHFDWDWLKSLSCQCD